MNYNPIHPHCGPGNTVAGSQPLDVVDATCWEHDKQYGELIDSGINPYTTFTKYDQEFIDRMDKLGFPIYSAPFKAKKILSWSFGKNRYGMEDDFPDNRRGKSFKTRGAVTRAGAQRRRRAIRSKAWIVNARRKFMHNMQVVPYRPRMRALRQSKGPFWYRVSGPGRRFRAGTKRYRRNPYGTYKGSKFRAGFRTFKGRRKSKRKKKFISHNYGLW